MTQWFYFCVYIQINPKHKLKRIYASVFIADLFMIAKIRKEPKGLLIDEWIKNSGIDIYTMKYHSAKKIMKSNYLWKYGWT